MRKCCHPTAPDLYQFQRGAELTEGVQSFAFLPAFDLPLYSYSGAGRVVGFMRLGEAPATAVHARPVAGLGGIQAGQKFMQPLTDPFGE